MKLRILHESIIKLQGAMDAQNFVYGEVMNYVDKLSLLIRWVLIPSSSSFPFGMFAGNCKALFSVKLL